MNIRTRLTLNFFGIVIIVVSIISASIYYFSAQYRQQDFYRRLKNRANNTAKLLMEFEEVNASLLQRMERENPANLPRQSVTIYNYKNEVLFSTEGEIRIPVDTTLLNKIRLTNEVRFIYNDFEVMGFLYTDQYDRFTVVAAAIDTNGRDALSNLRVVLIITFCISVILVSILGWIFSGRVLKPISKIVKEVGTITEANLDRRLDEGNRVDELSKLSQTFNKMLTRLQRAFFSQKHFIANASHEIKTPITVMAGEIEVTLLKPRSNEYYVNVLQSVLGGIKGMNKLSTQLLLLAQTSADNPEIKFSTTRIDDILWAVKDEITKANPNYQIDIHFDLNLVDADFIVAGDIELLKIVMLNLIDNGCKYSTDGKVTVTLTSSQEHITLEFVNNGPGIENQNLSRVFEPFFRIKTNKLVKGFGIGLPLAKRILDLHSGTITIDSKPNKTTTFRVTLPHGALIRI
jgi:signal transduction histidine kinase